jgi:hypothetical protein
MQSTGSKKRYHKVTIGSTTGCRPTVHIVEPLTFGDCDYLIPKDLRGFSVHTKNSSFDARIDLRPTGKKDPVSDNDR